MVRMTYLGGPHGRIGELVEVEGEKLITARHKDWGPNAVHSIDGRIWFGGFHGSGHLEEYCGETLLFTSPERVSDLRIFTKEGFGFEDKLEFKTSQYGVWKNYDKTYLTIKDWLSSEEGFSKKVAISVVEEISNKNLLESSQRLFGVEAEEMLNSIVPLLADECLFSFWYTIVDKYSESGKYKLDLNETVELAIRSSERSSNLLAALDHNISLEREDRNSLMELFKCASINIPNYNILRRLGQGKQGETFEAVYTPTNGLRALKIIDSDKYNQEEAGSMERLRHENTVRVHCVEDLVVDGKEKKAIVMDYVDGNRLDDLISSGNIRKAEGISYSHQILRAVEAIEGIGIKHRDIQPQNILISKDDGTVKVCDFGLATSEDHPKPRGGPYTSPGKEAEDSFQWGLTVYRIFSDDISLLSDRHRQSIGSSAYLEKIAEAREDLRTEKGKLKRKYKRKVNKTVPKELRTAVIAALEGNSLETILEEISRGNKPSRINTLLGGLVLAGAVAAVSSLPNFYLEINKDVFWKFVDYGLTRVTVSESLDQVVDYLGHPLMQGVHLAEDAEDPELLPDQVITSPVLSYEEKKPTGDSRRLLVKYIERNGRRFINLTFYELDACDRAHSTIIPDYSTAPERFELESLVSEGEYTHRYNILRISSRLVDGTKYQLVIDIGGHDDKNKFDASVYLSPEYIKIQKIKLPNGREVTTFHDPCHLEGREAFILKEVLLPELIARYQGSEILSPSPPSGFTALVGDDLPFIYNINNFSYSPIVQDDYKYKLTNFVLTPSMNANNPVDGIQEEWYLNGKKIEERNGAIRHLNLDAGEYDLRVVRSSGKLLTGHLVIEHTWNFDVIAPPEGEMWSDAYVNFSYPFWVLDPDFDHKIPGTKIDFHVGIYQSIKRATTVEYVIKKKGVEYVRGNVDFEPTHRLEIPLRAIFPPELVDKGDDFLIEVESGVEDFNPENNYVKLRTKESKLDPKKHHEESSGLIMMRSSPRLIVVNSTLGE